MTANINNIKKVVPFVILYIENSILEIFYSF
jgi:hypothetical protein